MPNVLLTQACVRSCPYCFAKKHMANSPPDDILSWENLIYIADLFIASGEKRFPILGGEPTIHPEFNNMTLYLLERGFAVTVFTSGIMTNQMLEEASSMFGSIDPEKLNFVCNINDPEKTRTPLAETESVKSFFKKFSKHITPGFNIYRTDFDLEFLFEYINEFGLNRHIRIGIAHPIPGKKNKYIHIEDIGDVIERLFSFIPKFERFRIKPGLDCGFPLCLFSERNLAWLVRFTGKEYTFGCGPVIDIGPDMSVWSCFPLSEFHKKSIFEFNSIQEIHDYYKRLNGKIHVEMGGIFKKCDDCIFREDNICAGGCIAHCLSKFQKEAPVRMKELYI